VRCCAEDGGLVALRRPPAVGGVKPPRAALAEDRRGERRGKGSVRAVRWGFRKTNESEPPMKCRDLGTDIRTGVSMQSRDEPGGDTAYWPGGVRHVGGVSLICGFCAERGKARVDAAPASDRWAGARGSASSSGNCETSSTDAARAGGPARSSDEAPVIGVERRGWLIRDFLIRATRDSWEETNE
jgi:hypothetical protein